MWSWRATVYDQTKLKILSQEKKYQAIVIHSVIVTKQHCLSHFRQIICRAWTGRTLGHVMLLQQILSLPNLKLAALIALATCSHNLQVYILANPATKLTNNQNKTILIQHANMQLTLFTTSLILLATAPGLFVLYVVWKSNLMASRLTSLHLDTTYTQSPLRMEQ